MILENYKLEHYLLYTPAQAMSRTFDVGLKEKPRFCEPYIRRTPERTRRKEFGAGQWMVGGRTLEGHEVDLDIWQWASRRMNMLLATPRRRMSQIGANSVPKANLPYVVPCNRFLEARFRRK